MSAYKPKPCRMCGCVKERLRGRSHSWYCAPCSDKARSQTWPDRCSADSDGHQWWLCLDCTRIKKDRQRAAALRGIETRRKNFPERMRPFNAQAFWQRKAHSMVKAAIRHGVLPKLDGTIACSDCGAIAKVYEHRDYSRPLEVDPTCDSCNKRRGTAKWPERCIAIEEATGGRVTRYDLRADVFGPAPVEPAERAA